MPPVRAVLPPSPAEDFALTAPLSETPQERIERLKQALQEKFGGHFVSEEKPQVLDPEYSNSLILNTAWERSGFRGEVAKLLYERGMERKAVRWFNCGHLGQRGVCNTYPLEHKFWRENGCEVIFCPKCGGERRRELFLDYFPVILSVITEHGLPPAWVLARINFTSRSDGSPITPERVKAFNAAVRETMQRTIGSKKGYGMLFVNEVGHEERGHIANRVAGGLNLHCHGVYFGPFFDWERTRDIWMEETEKRFSVASMGVWAKPVRLSFFSENVERAARWALNYMLKYVSKPPAVSAERLADLIVAFHGARHVHALGLFYAQKPNREKKNCPCPKCRAMGIVSVVSFEGRVLPKGGRMPRLFRIEDLKAQGYEDLRLAGRDGVLSSGKPREDTWGESP